MLPIQNILHPTDFSERSEWAFRLACALARDYGSKLLVLHVSPPLVTAYGDMVYTQPIDVTVKDLKAKLRQLQGPEGVPMEYRLEEGDPATEIVQTAQDAHCDLIVMGTHGRRGFGRLLMGSVAEQVLRRATCPVVTVKTPFPEAVQAGAKSEPEAVQA
jgi:nucleotide-binding universal stress UspA family protein